MCYIHVTLVCMGVTGVIKACERVVTEMLHGPSMDVTGELMGVPLPPIHPPHTQYSLYSSL